MKRNTKQRDAIRQVFERRIHPLAPQEVLEEAQALSPGLGIATVYRNLKALVDDGWLVPVLVPGEPDRYERAGKRHHHHFRCRDCEGLFDVEGCVSGLEAMLPDGFQLEGHELTLYGRCGGCQGE
ncbi:MAG: transcriptional repressor [Planctomycetota bacterium]